MRFEGNRLEYELDRFDRPGLPDSSRAEVVDYLVNNAHERAPHAGKRLSNFALDKKDSELWNRSVRAYSYTNGLSTFGAKEIVQALEVFGFDEVKIRYIISVLYLASNTLLTIFIYLVLSIFYSKTVPISEGTIPCKP